MRGSGDEIIEQFGGDVAAYVKSLRAKTRTADQAKAAAQLQARGRWHRMMRRCNDPKHAAYPNYGGRGIEVDRRWYDFAAYYADTGPQPFPGASLDRQDNDGPYAPGNVRWATHVQQAANRRTSAPVKIDSQPGGKWRVRVRLERNFSSAAAAEDFMLALQAAIGAR